MQSIPQKFLLLAACLAPLATAQTPAKGKYLVYFGTYTTNTSKGIYCSRFDAATGKLGPAELAAETSEPHFVTIHPTRQLLYSTCEVSGTKGEKVGAISSYTIDTKTGKLKLLNTVKTGGINAAFVNVDATGHNALSANFTSGSVAVMPIKEDGSLAEVSSFVQHKGSSIDPKRQQGPHAHSINLSPDNRFAIVADLGVDKLFVYRFDAVKGALTPNEPAFAAVKPGAGPRHFVFHPNRKFGYLLTEMGGTVIAYTWNAQAGVFTELQTISTLPPGFSGTNSSAEVQIHPSGKFLYASNRGHDSIAVFSVNAQGKLTFVEHAPSQGKTPRNLRMDPSGKWMLVANQDSNNIAVFRIDQKTGKLTPTGQTVEVGNPVCVKFVALR